MGLSHREFRAVLCEAFRRRFSREPTRNEAQFAHAVAELETSCGDGWADPEHDKASNFGAIQAGGSWTGPTFTHRDSSPQPDGSNRWYLTKFRSYQTPVDGAVDLVRVVYQARGREKAVLPAAQAGNSLDVSRGLYQTVYFEGHGRTADERIKHHHLALTKALERIARDLGEPLPGGSEPPAHPARVLYYRPGNLMRGEDVRAMQEGLGVKQDGVFGLITRGALVEWQRANRLKPDGFFGPVSARVMAELADDELEETKPG